MMEKNLYIQKDIMLYKKNKLSSSLALLGLAFNCLYFMLLYSLNNNTFYSLLIGCSVVLTLAILLVAFYASEGIKNYKKSFSIVLLVLAVIQIIRIFIYPLTVGGIDSGLLAAQTGLEAKYVVFYFGVGLTPVAAEVFLIIYLLASAGCFIASAVSGYIIADRLEKYIKSVDSGEVNIDDILKETDAFVLPSSKDKKQKEEN